MSQQNAKYHISGVVLAINKKEEWLESGIILHNNEVLKGGANEGCCLL